MNEVITQNGEVVETSGPASLAVQLQQAEIDQLVTTARAYPRSLKHVQNAILSMATLDEASAEECMYALPRGGKPIKGPSIRFAEILKQSFGNCRAAARVVHVDKTEMYVEAEGVFHDLETNSASTARVRRRISNKQGRLFNDDMIIVTGNAACAIAMRNAILAGVPKPLWRRAYEQVEATIVGDVTTLSANREKALKALAGFGVSDELVLGALGREGIEDVSVEDIATLRGMYSALKNGEATVEEMFHGTVKAVSHHEQVADPLADAPQAQPEAEPAQDETATVDHVDEQNSDVPPASDQEAADMSSADASTEGGEVSPPASPPSPLIQYAGYLVRMVQNFVDDGSITETDECKKALNEAWENATDPDGIAYLVDASEETMKKAKSFTGWAMDVIDQKTSMLKFRSKVCEVANCRPEDLEQPA